MKYLKKFESFYNEDFKELKENLGKRESEEDEKSGDQGFASKDDKSASSNVESEVEAGHASGSEGGSGHDTSISSDLEAEVESHPMSNSEGGANHNTSVSSDIPKEVETPTMESNEESSIEGEEASTSSMMDEEEKDEDCEENSSEVSSEEKLEEGKIRKFLTGHESSEARDKKKSEFAAALDKLDAQGAGEAERVAYDRASIEQKASKNNYKGGIRVQRGGRDKNKAYVVYDPGFSGFQELAAGAGIGRAEALGG